MRHAQAPDLAIYRSYCIEYGTISTSGQDTIVCSCGVMTFDGVGLLPETRCERAVRRPRILVDGIFWQYLSSGIARVWENLLREWLTSGFADNVVLLDRVGTAPRIPGVHYWTIARHDYQQTGRDSLYLEAICRQLDADVFVSTYYSTPTTTPSFFLGYDMIPEVLAFPLHDEAWCEKQRAILHASARGMISRNSARDLEKTHPFIAPGSTYVTYCGVDPNFTRPAEDVVDSFRNQHGLNQKTYVLMVGERIGLGGYKNGSLAFRALAYLPADMPLALICIGGQENIEPQLWQLAPKLDVRRLALNDADLCAAYAGAHALLYPSKYEGFGMPPLESMACGTPAIVCRNSSLPEVVGEAALYVDENDPASIAVAIMKLYDPGLRADLVERGVRQAAQFTFANMAQKLAGALVETHDRLQVGDIPRPSAAWTELRGFQQGCQAYCIDINAPQAELDEALQTISSMRNSPFWKAREAAVRLLRKTGLRRRA